MIIPTRTSRCILLLRNELIKAAIINQHVAM